VLPDIPRELATRCGPVASVYLEVSRDHDDAPHEVELRWKALAAALREQGADQDTIQAVEGAVLTPHSQPGPAGRAVFAAEGRVLLERDLPAPPRREIARWSLLPHLLPLLAQTPEYVPYVTVQLGRTTADIHAFDRTGREVLARTEPGAEHHVHKIRGGGSAHLSIQRRVEEVWADNARGFAAEVDRVVSQISAELVVLSGDVRARNMVLDALGKHSRSIAEQVSGPVPDDRTTEPTPAQADEARRLAAERATGRTREILDRFEQEHGRASGLAVAGSAPVIRALRANQVRTLLLRDDPSANLQLWIGPEPTQLALTEQDLQAIDAPVLGRDRADAALLRGVAATGADLLLLPHPATDEDPRRTGSAAGSAPLPGEQPDLADGLGALLRFSTS
jgi:hypothetical protein